MAAKTWNDTGSGIWNDANNWLPVGIPAAADTVTFDNTSVANCAIGAPTNLLTSMTVAATYTGTITNNSVINTTSLTNNGAIVNAGTITGGSGTFAYANTGASLTGNGACTIAATGTISAIAGTVAQLLLKVFRSTNNMAATNYSGFTTVYIDCDAGGAYSQQWNAGTYTFNNLTYRAILGDLSVDCSVNTPVININGAHVMEITNNTGTITLQTCTNGYTINGNHTMHLNGAACATANAITINNSTGQFWVKGNFVTTKTGGPAGTMRVVRGAGDIRVDGTVSFASLDTYTKSTGNFILGGSAGTQTINFASKTLDDLQIACAGATKQFTAGFTTDSIAHTAGAVDWNGQTIVSSGAWSVSGTASFSAGSFDGLDMTVGGIMTLSGSSSNILDLNGTAWALNVTGVASASYVSVKNSDASAGSTVSARNSTDLGSNLNWSFSVPVGKQTTGVLLCSSLQLTVI